MQIAKLGPYRIGKKIGKGGMGAVYEAVSEIQDESLGQRVAIKALSPQLALAEGFRERFEAEIDSLKKLQHPGIVRLYGYGEQDGILFYSMELVEGTSLEEEIKSGRRFDWRETLNIGIQICRALKHAHDHGVVHRDIKPANLLLTPEGVVKIADFGIARLFGGTQLTTAGGVLGTADYMSPEQADGRAVTEKCDQYSLGGVLYALLAGRPPFRAKTMPEMLQMQRFAEPEPVSRYAPDTPKELERLLTQLLAKEPEDRFPNVLVLSRHMEAMQKALSRPVVEQPEANAYVDEHPTNPIPLDFEGNIHDQPTQAVEPLTKDSPIKPSKEILIGLADAPTVAKPEGPQTLRTDSTAIEGFPSMSTGEKSTRFTTVAEETQRQQRQTHENSIALILQLFSLLLAIGVLIGGGWYLMRPASADELYETISSKIESEGSQDLSIVSHEIDQFLTQFPNDNRVDEIKLYQEKLEFQRFERRLRLKSRINGESMSAVEKIYAQAMVHADDDPAETVLKLRAMITLFDPQGETQQVDPADLSQDQLLINAARSQVDDFEKKLSQEAEEQYPALKERFTQAKKLSFSNPQLAREMYQAIIDLYGTKKWAAPIVDEAKAEFEQLNDTL